MPRDGSGRGDNAIETDPAFGQTIAHGAGADVSNNSMRRFTNPSQKIRLINPPGRYFWCRPQQQGCTPTRRREG